LSTQIIKLKTTFITVLLITIVVGKALAQEPETTVTYVPAKYFYLNLDINTPLSNTSWLGATSTRGLRVGYRHFITRSFSAGIDFGWASYNEYFPRQTFETSTGAVTTDYFNYLTSISVAASAQYNFKMKSEILYPYVGIGLGAMGNEYTTYYNVYTNQESSWGFLARPEAGVLIRFSKRRAIGAMAAVHYDYSTNQSENGGYSNFSAVGFQIGVMFMDWKFSY
jgi:hypothetical protein